jgi:hypothetical protein
MRLYRAFIIIVKKYVPIDLANFSKVIASEAKQSPRVSRRLLRRQAPTRLSRSTLSLSAVSPSVVSSRSNDSRPNCSRPKGSSQARNDRLSKQILDNRYILPSKSPVLQRIIFCQEKWVDKGACFLQIEYYKFNLQTIMLKRTLEKKIQQLL